MKKLAMIFVALVTVMLLSACMSAVQHREVDGVREASPREISVCKARFPLGLFMDEESVFACLKNSAGGGADTKCGPGRGNVRTQADHFPAGDGAILSGCRFSAGTTVSSGYALIVQGNAWMAHDVVETLMPLADAHPTIDFYVYDFRGYGGSEGNSFLHAIIEDYKDILNHLNQQYEDADKHLYGFSLGGLVLANALGDSPARDVYHSVVIDSSPGTADFDQNFLGISFNVGSCADEYDPERRLDKSGACRNFTFLHAPGDRVVPLHRTQPFWDAVEQCGGTPVLLQAEECDGAKGPFRHPFQEEDALIKCRLERIGRELFGPR